MPAQKDEFETPIEFDELVNKYFHKDSTFTKCDRETYLEFIGEVVKIAKNYPQHDKGVGIVVSGIGLKNSELEHEDTNISIINSIFCDIEMNGGSKSQWGQIERELSQAVASLPGKSTKTEKDVSPIPEELGNWLSRLKETDVKLYEDMESKIDGVLARLRAGEDKVHAFRLPSRIEGDFHVEARTVVDQENGKLVIRDHAFPTHKAFVKE